MGPSDPTAACGDGEQGAAGASPMLARGPHFGVKVSRFIATASRVVAVAQRSHASGEDYAAPPPQVADPCSKV